MYIWSGKVSRINVLQTIYNIIVWNASKKYAYFPQKECIKCIKIKIYLHNIHKKSIIMHKWKKNTIIIGKDNLFLWQFLVACMGI